MPHYDWDNQCTDALLEREKGKVKGMSEPEASVVDLRDIPMSAQDYANYVGYLRGDISTRRSPEHIKTMCVHLRDMGEALKSGNGEGYHSARELFLNEDGNYRNERRQEQESLLWHEEDKPNTLANEHGSDLWYVPLPERDHDYSSQQCGVGNTSDNQANSSNEQETQGTAQDNSILM